MKEFLNYLFRPSKNSREAIKSAYAGSLKPAHLMMFIGILVGLFFLVLSFILPDLFGETIIHHRISYAVLFLIGLSWSLVAYNASKDFDSRYRTVCFMNVLTEFVLFALVLALAYVNLRIGNVVDTTLYMMVSMLVPLCVYTNPIEFLLISIFSNLTMIAFLLQAYISGISTSNNALVNSAIFSIFQLAMGLTMLYTRYRLHEQLVTAAKQHDEIEMLNKAQNSFFSNMSHEIRTPINTIIGLNEMILREDVSEEVVEDAANIKAAGKLLLNLINDILDMSKFQSGKMQLLYAPYHTGDMLSDIVGML